MNKIKIKYYENSCIYGEILHKHDWFVFLDSCYDVSGFGEHDIISCNPYMTLISYGNKITVNNGSTTSSFYDDPIDVIKNMYNFSDFSSEIPFDYGLIGYFGYEAFNSNEYLLEGEFPDIAVGFYNWAIVVNHKSKETYLSYKFMNDFVEYILKTFNICNLMIHNIKNCSYKNFKQLTKKIDYINDVNKIKQYISNGDCYQVNYSQEFKLEFSGNPWDIYKKIRDINPAPYSSFYKINNKYIISSSPERFISVKNNIVETKPIKGTIKRKSDPNLDAKQINILKNDEKNISENLMIVDLLRNDISKCCKLNSVKVDKLFNIESYASVHHMVSTISAILKDNITSLDLLKSCFPGGSITGAPKKRSMEIIRELEKRKRGIYCGSIGYFNGNNNMDTNISIRTLTLTNGKISFSAGGGIVCDSDAIQEYYESMQKVAIFINYFSNGNFKW